MTSEKIPSWIERLLLPKLSEIGGDIKALDVKIGSLRNETKTEIEGLRKEILSKFEGIDYRFEAINTKLDSLEKRIPVIEKITALEIKIAELEKRLAAA